MIRARDLGGAVWAFFSFDVLSHLVKGSYLLLSTRVGSLALIGALGAFAFHVLGPEPKRLDSLRRAVADSACAEAVDKLPHDKSVYRIAVLPFERDYTSYISDTLRSRLAATGRYNVSDKGFWERLMKTLNRDPWEVVGADAALHAGRRMGLDAVVFGVVPEQAEDAGKAGIVMNVTMLRVSTGERIADFTIEQGINKSLASPRYVESQVHNSALLGRVTLWATLCLALPVILSFLVQRVTRLESNAFNALMLAGFVAVDVVLAVLVLNVPLSAYPGWLVLLLAGGAAAGYNYVACTKIDEVSR
jgi:hypothetical protein